MHGADHETLALELAAQTMHVHLDRVVADSAVAVGERGGEPRFLHDVSRALHQRREHVELSLRQRERRAAQLRELARINLQRSVDQRLLAAARAPNQRSRARLELFELEGLREIVVGAELQTEHLVLEPVTRGEHEHGHGVLARAQAAQHVEAVDLRQP